MALSSSLAVHPPALSPLFTKHSELQPVPPKVPWVVGEELALRLTVWSLGNDTRAWLALDS